MSRSVRVFAISHSCVVPEYRLRHAEAAKHDGIEITLLTPEHWRQFNRECVSPPKDESHRYQLLRRQPMAWGIPFHGLRNASHIYPGLAGMLAEAKPDILELWAEPFFAVSWQAMRVFRRVNPSGKVLFFSAQNLKKWRPLPYAWFEKSLFRTAAGCYAMNRDVLPVLQAKGWDGRNEILPLGIDPVRYDSGNHSDSLRKKLGLTGTVIGFLGKLTFQKGILDLLAALESLKPDAPYSVLMVGNGDLRGEVEARLRALSVPARCLDAVEHDAVPEVLGAMDIVAMPSRTLPTLKEQFGRVAAEAMACGRAVVVSDSGELPNVVGDAGCVVPEGDVGALRDALEILIRDEGERRRLGEAARQRAETEFAWSAIAARQVALYRELIK